MSYTDEQYRKDKKKLIGVGLLFCALFIILLHSWNIGRLDEMRAKRIEIEKQREIKRIAEPAIPGFRDIFDFDKVISPEMMDKIIERIGKVDVYDREIKFTNFKITVSSEWIEIEKGLIPPEISDEIGKANAEILFLAHNFDIERIVLDMIKRGEIGIFDMPKIDPQKIGAQEILIFSIVEFRELKGVTDFVETIREFDEREKYFEIIKKDVKKTDEDQIRIDAKFSLLLKINGRIEEIQIYSYKKIILIDESVYAFIFMSDLELTEENRKEVDKILESVIMN